MNSGTHIKPDRAIITIPVSYTHLRNALSVPFYELERYSSYVTNNTRFATHQGVKGLEFPRVMAVSYTHLDYLLKDGYKQIAKTHVLNGKFYQELLYLMGLKEAKVDKKNVIIIDRHIF